MFRFVEREIIHENGPIFYSDHYITDKNVKFHITKDTHGFGVYYPFQFILLEYSMDKWHVRIKNSEMILSLESLLDLEKEINIAKQLICFLAKQNTSD